MIFLFFFSLMPSIQTSLVAQTVKHLSTIWETRVRSLGRGVPWRRKWQSTPVLLPGKSHGQRCLVGYSPWGRKESDTTEQLHFHFSFMDLIFQVSMQSCFVQHRTLLLSPITSTTGWCCCFGSVSSFFLELFLH